MGSYTAAIDCIYCGNRSAMPILDRAQEPSKYDDDGYPLEEGHFIEMCQCPSCDKIVVRISYTYRHMDPRDVKYTILSEHVPRGGIKGLPASVNIELKAAESIRRQNPNAYAVLLGRTLEAVCKDKSASGDSLYKKIEDLANRGEIPDRLKEMAHTLRQLRNVGGHSDLGSLTEQEVPFLESLCRAILEYLYTAPLTIAEAEQRYQAIKSGSTNNSTT